MTHLFRLDPRVWDQLPARVVEIHLRYLRQTIADREGG